MLSSNRNRPAIIIAVLFSIIAIAGTSIAGPNTLIRDEIPDKYKWDLNDIYPNWETWEKGLAELEAKMDEYADLKGTLGQGPEQLLKAYKLDDQLGMLSYKVYRYPALTRATDTRDNEIGAKLQQVQITFSKFNVATAWFQPELLEIPWETMKDWLDETDELKPYRFLIEDLYRQQEHVHSEDKEILLSYFSPFRGTPSTIYNELSISDIKFNEITLSDGETATITEGKYRNILATNRNQDDRQKAFEALYSVYHENVNTYAAIYNSVLQRDWSSAQARNYNSSLEAALDGDNVPVEVYKNLIARVKEGMEPVRRYMRLRKNALGLDVYHLYDGSIPLVDFNKTYEYDDAKPWILEAIKPLGKEYGKKIKTVFQDGWIDVYENEGKSSGAFSAGVYGVHPFILMNYNETMDNVFTLAHEAGHATHTLLSQENQPFATSSYTIFVAEVASTLTEALLLDYFFDKTDDPKERIALLQQAIDNIVGTFYSQVLFADFEWRAHKMVEEGQPITADALRALYLGMEEEYYGDAVFVDDLYGSLWSRISHFYDVPFYVYKYATCFATSAQIFQEIKSPDRKISDAAKERYLILLKSGGNDYPMEQLKKAGVDLSQQEAFQAVVNQLDDLVARLETELDRL
ncbi:MAG: oligoendopeptidase F [candidate division Zixibacteria bacterium]|nr:oligoendopeptidase F [candidate division Zixibacteria bacterium]